MSIAAITWAFSLPISASAGKFVLVALADFADEAGSCFPGQERLATMTGQSTRTVRRQLAFLEEQGHIAREARYDRHGQRTSDRYLLGLPAMSSDSRTNYRPIVHAPPANRARTPGQAVQVTIRKNQQEEPPATHSPAPGGARKDGDTRSDSLHVLDAEDAQFEQFWSASRRKVDRKRTRIAWDDARKRNVDALIMVKEMRAYTSATAGRDVSKVKHPLTWLRNECWNDELPPASENRLDAGIGGAAKTNLKLEDKPWHDLMQFAPIEETA